MLIVIDVIKHEYHTDSRAIQAQAELAKLTKAVRFGSAVVVAVTAKVANDLSNVMMLHHGEVSNETSEADIASVS